MKLAGKGLDFLKSWETLKLRPYDDGYGYMTIGWGHLIQKGEDFSSGITREQADDILRRDLAWVERAVNSKVSVPLTQQQYDALVSLVFNIGLAFSNSTLRRLLNAGNYDGAREQFARWNRSGGKVSNGLIKRRAQEVRIWQDGVYELTH